MRSLRILIACMAILGATSVVASNASAAGKKVNVPGCNPSCRLTARTRPIGGGGTTGGLLLKAEGEELRCTVHIELTLTNAGHVSINEVTVRPGEPLCEVVEIFEETLPWRGKICERSAGVYSVPINNVAFFAPIGGGTYEGPLTASVIGSGSPFIATGAGLSNSEIGTSGGQLTGTFAFSEGGVPKTLELQPDRNTNC